ncbi:hypothetical protein L218DRAFT_385939 [Marasmius fiardii PR-910]|nr:hypothetical protein L218DRAFT_385939 [Marasmius fiardii PR-910]
MSASSPLVEIRSMNGIGRESVGIRDRESSRYTKEREREHDREREHHAHQTGPGPPLTLERMPAPREREREYERESRERPPIHHSQTLPTPLRTTPLSSVHSTSNPPSPKLHYPYPNGHPSNTSHPPDAHRRHTVPFPPPNSSSSPSLGRPSGHSSAQHHDHQSIRAPLPPSTSHPTSFSRHQLQSHPRRHSQGHGRDEDVVMVSPVSPVLGGSGAPFVASRSTFPPPHSTSSGTRRLSGVGLSTASTHAGTTATSPIVVSPTDSVDDAQRSSVLGKRERADRDSDSRRDSITSTGAPLSRSRSGSGSTSRPTSVVLAPHLVRGGGSTHASPRMHSSTTQPQQPSSSYQYSHSNHPTHSSPQSTPHPAPVAQAPPPVYTGVLPTPGTVPPGSVVYVYGYPPPSTQTQPAPVVHSSQPPAMPSGNPLSLSSHPHIQPQPLPHSPISARAPNPTSAPPQAGGHSLPHSQSQGQPVTRRQTYPQQIPGHPAQAQQQQPPPPQPHPHPHSQQHPHHAHQQLHGQPQGHPHGAHGSSQQQQHHHHPQPHHQHTYPPPSGIKQIPLSPNMKHHVLASASSPTVAQPPSHSHSHSQSHSGSHRSQHQSHMNAQDPHHHQPPPSASSGGAGGGGASSASVSTTNAATTTGGTATHNVHPAATAAIQRILNAAYADLLILVDKETSGPVHSLEKERSKREKLERALEERDRVLRAREDEMVVLGNALRAAHGAPPPPLAVVGSNPEKEKEMSKLLSENTHLKSELMGLKADKEEMQEEIDELTEKVGLSGGGGDGSEHLRELEELRSMENRRVEELQMLRVEVERWRDEAQAWRQEKLRFMADLDERDKEIRALLERRKQLEQNSTNTEQAAPMITASPTEGITASPLPFTVPLSPSPRPNSRQSAVDNTPHHSSTLAVLPIMGSLPPQSPRLTTNGTGRPTSRHDVVDEGRHHQTHRSQPPQRPHLTLPVPLSDERPIPARPSAVSPPHSSMSLPLPTPDRPSSARLSPNQLSIPLPVPFTNSRPPSRPSLSGRKRSREDFNAEPGLRREREDVDKPEKPSRTEPPSRPLQSPTTTSQEKASKVAKRHSGDDASTASGPPPPPAAPNDTATTPSTPTFPTIKNPYVTHPKPRPKSGSISVEDGVFRHVQHPSRGMTVNQQFHFQQQQQQQQHTSSFWKNVPSSASATTQTKKDEEPKLSLKHFTLLYETVGKDYICRECKTSTTTKRKTFPDSTPFPELLEHWWQEHEDRCKEVLKYSPSKLTEEQVLLKGGGGVLLGKATGSGHGGPKSGSASQRKEKSNSK